MSRDLLLLKIKRSRDKLAPTNIRRTHKTAAAAPRLSSHRVKAYKTLGFILRKLPIRSDINIVFTVSVRPSHLPIPSIKGDGARISSGRDHLYRQDFHAPAKLSASSVT